MANNSRALTTRQPQKQTKLITHVDKGADLSDFPGLQQTQRNLQALEQAFSLMEPGTDYGRVPGIDKPFLYKAGAERLCQVFGLILEQEDIDDSRPEEDFYRHKVVVKVYKIEKETGQQYYVGMGTGSCSSRESKYRYRWFKENELPSEMKIGLMKTIGIKDENGKINTRDVIDIQKYIDTYGIGTAKMSKFGAKFRVDNPDMADVDNTILKMAAKRARADAVQTVTGADRIFSRGEEIEDATVAQSIEDASVDGAVAVEDIDIEAEVTEKPKAQPAQKSKLAETSEETDRGKFLNKVKAYCISLGWELSGMEMQGQMKCYPNCKRFSDLSKPQRDDLLKTLAYRLDNQDNEQGTTGQTNQQEQPPLI